MRATVIRVENFNAAHRLFIKEWDDEKNRQVFGPCSNPFYHGHNYRLEVRVTGDIDPKTGFVVDLKQLKDIIHAEVIERFDHRNLNLDTEEFKDINPTAENIAVVIYNILRPHLKLNQDLKVKLFETDKNIVEYPV